ncbi:UDP-N-acetylenolpyruvoylglucosamine reductase [Bacteroides coprosuis DSM 18011]|uniref:UDP-N-acetylenolpyruvoylglucosamine reductase n=1 Tax=Bacteroides coprosuis DSM 18011 TaxID=679937 RepID=F3ZUQ5_9BACE|nr:MULTISPECIES: UDP-N-acetylmuramate dehydrogenase [Bacteroides]EGJ71220.1 UDP-N-acetylenolpyruvoylglucosamine reductase [Bacteroides coprosuis DSM 18011]
MIEIKNNYSLRSHNTFRIDVRAKKFIEYSSKESLKSLIETGEVVPPFLHIGSGSNLLFLEDYDGTILHSKIEDIDIVEEDEKSLVLRVGSGVNWDELVAYTVSKSWYGLENLSLIPGEVGASAVQNIGAYGVEVKDFIQLVETIDLEGRKRNYSPEECQYAYRYSIFKEKENKNIIVTHVHYKLSKQEQYNLEYGSIQRALSDYEDVNLANVREAIIKIRQTKLPDPEQIGNAGSFFMNPVVDKVHFEKIQKEYPDMPFYRIDEDHIKIPAGWMIDICGWKGKSIGQAGVHDKQALVLINKGTATGSDVLLLSKAIQKDVYQKFGIEIYPEVNFIG